ncbi:MAG TPA: alpha/beta hydrolase [Hyphomonadaceae bacterium]|jgi:pimeloyl-ACP methyl ester carboxylesterase|nr:alpha/beta hydrolase [Hyphomonadaceae bacterium]
MFSPSAASQFVKLPSGATARYIDRPGPSKTLVLLHGGNCSLESWDAVADRLTGKARIISLDMPGHGLTGPTPDHDYSPIAMVRFLSEFTEALKLNSFALGGHSMGGHVAWRYALEYPDQVTKLILVAAGGLANPTGIPGVGMKYSATEKGREAMRAGQSRERMELGLRDMFGVKSAVTPELVDRNWDMASRAGSLDATMARFSAPMFEPAAIARLPDIAAPTLIIWGAMDNVFALRVSKTLEAIPYHQFAVYEGVGHFPHEEAPERVAADISAFL